MWLFCLFVFIWFQRFVGSTLCFCLCIINIFFILILWSWSLVIELLSCYYYSTFYLKDAPLLVWVKLYSQTFVLYLKGQRSDGDQERMLQCRVHRFLFVLDLFLFLLYSQNGPLACFWITCYLMTCSGIIWG